MEIKLIVSGLRVYLRVLKYEETESWANQVTGRSKYTGVSLSGHVLGPITSTYRYLNYTKIEIYGPF